MSNWPDDADGDVLRRLEESGFDFSRPSLVDFNVDLRAWPPAPKAVKPLSQEYPSAKVYEPEGESAGYIQFQLYSVLTYELVTGVQAYVSKLMAQFGGECNSWGVLS